MTLLGAMTIRGLGAAMTVESATDGDVFLAYLDQVLCPALRPGEIVIMDNLGAHKAIISAHRWLPSSLQSYFKPVNQILGFPTVLLSRRPMIKVLS
jgi:hypothetical protein